MTLRSKLNTVFGLILLVGFSILTSVILQQTRAQLMAEIRSSVNRALEDAIWSLEMNEALGNTDDLGQLITHRLELLLIGRRYLTHAEVIYHHGDDESGNFTIPLLPTPEGVAQDPADHKIPPVHQRIHATQYISRPDLDIKLTVYGDASLAIRFQRHLLTLVLSLAVIIVVVSLLLTSSLTKRLLTRPLGELKELTTRVGRGDLSGAPPDRLRNRMDELGTLANAFVAMVESLEGARAEKEALLSQLQGFNRDLEARIAAATQALGRKNAELLSTNSALIDAREQLTRQVRLAALGQLSASIAHEIGTPLSTISGHLQLLLLIEELSPEAIEAIEIAQGEAGRMTEIIRRFLSSTRGVQPTPQLLALPEFLSDALQLTLPPGSDANFSAKIYCAEEAASPSVDPGLLRQLLINLISNARDATRQPGHLVLEAKREGATLVLHVDDSGPGVPYDLRERIFEPFFTTKPSDQGTGLGLAICREIARALQGTLTVGDSPEGGARFTLRIAAWDDIPATG